MRFSTDDTTRASVVKIQTVIQEPDYSSPFRKGTPKHTSGTGVVIEGKRILTNAHVVAHALEVLIQPEHSSATWIATVEFLAAEVDLAVLKLEDESLFDEHPPLVRSVNLPRVQDPVTVYGYPQGGTALSITRGIVSRIEYAGYWFDAKGLRVQVDAAINPGNSGGPVMVGETMIGLVFMGLQQADNIGYLIPCEEIDLFLADIADGRYHGKPVFLDYVRPLENDALRRSLGLEPGTRGVLITGLGPVGPHESYPLRVGDAITRIGAWAIDNTGMVWFEGIGLIDFRYLVQKVARDGALPITIVRDGVVAEVMVPVGPERDTWLVPYLARIGGEPSYFIYGPLVFVEATSEAVMDLFEEWSNHLATTNSPLITRFGARPAFPGERLVYLSCPPFSHRILSGYQRGHFKVVAEINGVPVRNLKHMVELLRDARGEFVEFGFHTLHPERIVFRREEALRATEEVLSRSGIREQCSADLREVWQGKTS